MALASAVVLLSGCAGDTQQDVSGTVGPAGGTVSSSDGRVVLSIPPGALSANTVFSIKTGSGAPTSARLLGSVIDIEPSGTTFQVPAQLTLPLPTIPPGVVPSTLKVGTAVNGQWIDVPGSPVISQANGTITIQISHLSLYAVLQPEAADPTNQPPTAVIGGPASGTVNQVLTFSGSGSSDPDGDSLTYAWTFGDNETATGPSVTHAYAAATSYTVTLTVSDGRGGTAVASHTVSISTPTPGNQPPTANVSGPTTGTVGQSLTFDGAGSSDPNGDTLTYAWTFSDGPATAATSSVSHTFATAATHTVTLTVADGRGGTHSTSLNVTISPNQPPTAAVNGPYVGMVGQILTFSSAGSSDPENGALTYSWAFGDGTTASVASPTHAYSTDGTFTVTLTVRDSANLSASASTTATISPAPPNQLPTISGTTIPSNGFTMQNMVFNATASDPDGDVLTYRWDFGDGSPVQSGLTAGVIHQYASAGAYTVSLTVDDGRGGSASAGGSITISVPAAPIAYSQDLTIYMRQGSDFAYLSRYTVLLNGAGVPPLSFKIVSFPQYQDTGVSIRDMQVLAGGYYQWRDAATGGWRLECRKLSNVPDSCVAATSSGVDRTNLNFVVNWTNKVPIQIPSAVPPIVVFAPIGCRDTPKPLVDAFTFTVTDGTGATSDPATVRFTTIDAICKPYTH
jgi:PKD repeat protein